MSTVTSEFDGTSSPTFLSFFKSFARRQDEPTADATMLRFLLSTIAVRADLIGARVRDNQDRKEIVDRVKQALGTVVVQNDSTGILVNGLAKRGEDAWNEAYRLERLLALAEPSDSLVQETQRRIAEASEENVPAAPRLQKRFDQIMKDEFGADPPDKPLSPAAEINIRNLLQDVLEWHHWSSQRIFCLRPMQKSATNRIVSAEVLAFIFVVAPFAYIYLTEYISGRPPNFEYWSGLPFYLALTAGLFGAFFSRMQWLQSNGDSLSLSQVREAMDWRSIRLRGAVGMGGALIVYFFLQSGMVNGSLFPNFDDFGVHVGWTGMKEVLKDGQLAPAFSVHLFQPSPALALLVVWSFIAGFSERFVPGILSATETSLGSAASNQSK
jgi:hypothetical protein